MVCQKTKKKVTYLYNQKKIKDTNAFEQKHFRKNRGCFDFENFK